MNQNRGVVLYVVVILLLLLTIIAIAAMNTGVLEERIARNRYGNNESLFAAESGASKVVSCFSGGENDLCKNVLSPGGKERLSFLDNKPHDFFNANGKSVRFIAYNPKPAIVLPNPAQFVLPATAVGLPVAAWPRELDTSQTSETFCPPQASCVTASVYPKVASNEANAGIGSDLGYAIIAGGKVTIEEGTAQNGGNSSGGTAGGGSGTSGAGDGTGSGGTDQNSAPASTSPAPQTLDLQQHLWLAAFSIPSHRFDFPWLAQTGTGTDTGGTGGATGSGGANSGGTGGSANGGGTGGSGNNQNQQRVIAASIHGQDGIDLADVNVTGFATSGGTVTPASQVVVQIWDQGNCKDCFLDIESDFKNNFSDRINSYAETIRETYPDRFQEIQQGAFGSAQSSGNQGGSGSTGGGSQGGGNQDNSNQGGSTGGATGSGGANSGGAGGAAGGGGASLNLVPAPQTLDLQQHLWLAAFSIPSHRFDFPWLAQTGTGTDTGGTGGATGSGGANSGGTGGAAAGGTGTGGSANGGGTGGSGNNQNQQAVEFQDLQGKIYYYDGDVTIYGNAAPVNGTIVATGDIIVEPFTTGSSGSRLCPGDEPLVGQTIAAAQAVLQFGQAAIPWATTAATLAATVSASLAGTAATTATATAATTVTTTVAAPVTAPVAATGTAAATATAAAPLTAEQVLQFTLQTVKVLNQGRIAATELCGLARSAIGTARSAVGTVRGLLPSNGANNASNSSEQSGSQNSSNNAFDSSGQSNSPESFAPLNLIAGGNIELHRDLLGTMIAQGDITIGPEVMQIAYPPLPEEAPRMASWQRNYLLGTD